MFTAAKVTSGLRPILYLPRPNRPPPYAGDSVEATFAENGLRVIVPESGPFWWLSRIVPGFDTRWSAQTYVLEHLLPEAQARLGESTSTWGILGEGMGGQGALALAYRAPRIFPHVAAIAPELDFHLLVPHDDEILTETFGSREWARQHTPILGIHPLNWPPFQFFCCDPGDPWHDSADRLRMKLYSIGIPCTHDLETSVGGDPEAYAARMLPVAVEFLKRAMLTGPRGPVESGVFP